MPTTRTVGKRQPAQPAVDTNDFEFDAEPRPEKPVDLAIIVAEIMLRRAVAARPPGSLAIGSPGSVAIVQTPTAEWTAVAKDAWAVMAYGGTAPNRETERHWWHATKWVEFLREDGPDGPYKRNNPPKGDADFAEALWRGSSVGAFSPEPDEWLPHDVLEAADFRLQMRLPTSADLAAAARVITASKSTRRLTDAQAAAVTPHLLRLARRAGQTAAGYTLKLRLLLDRVAEAEDDAKLAPTPRDEPTLDRLHGMTEATDWGRALAADLREHVAGRLLWSQVSGHACLLSGPPGCGKSPFARALATSCGVPLVTGFYGEWHASGTSHQGDFLKAMRRTFSDAAKRAPCILFIDEIDSFPNRSTVTHSWAEYEIQVVNALLELIDGGAGREGVVVVGACNQPHLLDPALVRSGRLDKHLPIGLPDRAGLELILREHLGDDVFGEPLSGVALSLVGSTGADVERLVRAARARARRSARPMVLDDLVAEIGEDDRRTPEQLWNTAVHEAGHALALCEHAPGTLRGVTLHACEERNGAAVAARPGGTFLKGDITRRLVCILAGRAAEQVMFGEASSGAGGPPTSDLASATLIAATAASAFGLTLGGGLVWTGLPTVATLPRMLERSPRLAAEVEQVVAEAYGTAVEFLSVRMAELLALSAALLARRALEEADVLATVRKARRENAA